MAKQKQEKFVSEITPRDTDFAQWYTDVIKRPTWLTMRRYVAAW